MKYLVTGGAGFIGSHLVENLLLNNHTVLCVDDLSSGFLSNLPKSDALDFINSKIQSINKDNVSQIDGIFHLAAQASVPKSIDDFYHSSTNNMQGTFKVWELAHKLAVPVVYASSSAVYGNLPVGDDLEEKYDILSPYAQDKLSMEHYAYMAWKVYNTSSMGLRFFNVYGPRQDPSNPYSGVISIFIDRLLNGLTVTVNGGYQTRDFVYVRDVVNSLIGSMLLLHNERICDSFNVGKGISITIDQLLQSLSNIIDVKPTVIRAKLPKGDPERSGGIYTKLKKYVNTSTDKFTTIEEGLIKTVEYIKNDRIEKI